MKRHVEQVDYKAATLESDRWCEAEKHCPVQVLMLDQPDGPAELLMSIVSRLYGDRIDIFPVESVEDAWLALRQCTFNVMVIGTPEDSQPTTFIDCLHMQNPGVPMLVITSEPSQSTITPMEQHDQIEVIELPRRATELKSLIVQMTLRYFRDYNVE